ncbi:CHAD domain-containing protein [Variovorax humicola]|uniref:CHAD domain-containing protein n=1 Tax=Variovorax humicola TaxID=1769758 RepID=A0ABU8W9L4_9BURK
MLDTIEAEVIGLQRLARRAKIQRCSRFGVPGQLGHPLEIGAQHRGLARCIGHAPESGEFLAAVGLDICRHPGICDLFLDARELFLVAPRLAERGLDCLEWLAQQELALVIVEMLLGPFTDLLGQRTSSRCDRSLSSARTFQRNGSFQDGPVVSASLTLAVMSARSEGLRVVCSALINSTGTLGSSDLAIHRGRAGFLADASWIVRRKRGKLRIVEVPGKAGTALGNAKRRPAQDAVAVHGSRHVADGNQLPGRVLGESRDAEVLSVETLPALAHDAGGQSTWTALLQNASASAGMHRRSSAQALASHRYARLSLGLAAWLECMAWRTSVGKKGRKALYQPLRPYALRVSGRLHHKLIDAGKGIARARPAQRHRVRIAAKRLRYATDFFRSLYPGKPAQRYIERLAALQDVLGQLNDAIVAKRLLGELAGKEHRLAPSARAASEHLDRRSRSARPEVRKRWKDFKRMALR